MLPFVIQMYNREIGGVPSVTPYANLSAVAQSLEYTISDQFGFESATVTLRGGPREVMEWFGRLGSNMTIFGPGAERCWEGLLVGVEGTLGDERQQRSLDAMANRWRVRYTTVNGVQATTATASNAASVSRFGTKDGIESFSNLTSTAAENMRAALVGSERSWPVRRPSSTAATGTPGGAPDIVLTFAGWYSTLDWVMTSRTDTTTEATTTQVGALIGTSSPGIGATNAFLSTSTARIAASGISGTRYIAPETTYRQKIEDLLRQGNSSGQRLAWGVYEGRTFVVETWAGAAPANVTYRRSLASGQLTDRYGNRIDAWNVRPNAIYEIGDLIDSIAESNEPDAPHRYYVARTRFRIDRSGLSIDLEPLQSDSLDARLARLVR